VKIKTVVTFTITSKVEGDGMSKREARQLARDIRRNLEREYVPFRVMDITDPVLWASQSTGKVDVRVEG